MTATRGERAARRLDTLLTRERELWASGLECVASFAASSQRKFAVSLARDLPVSVSSRLAIATALSQSFSCWKISSR